MVRWGQVAHSEANLAQVKAAYRPDLYRDILAGSGTSVPRVDSRVEGLEETFIDGRSFSPDDIPAYVEGFPIRTAANAAVDE